MRADEVVVSDEPAVVRELSLLGGLTLDDLRQALMGGILARSTCTENDPPYFPGATFHGVTTRSFREQVLSRGWTKNDTRGYSRTISPDETVAIVVASGDEWTGRVDDHPNPRMRRQPKTTQSKGPLTESVVEANERQYVLEGVMGIADSLHRRRWCSCRTLASKGTR